MSKFPSIGYCAGIAGAKAVAKGHRDPRTSGNDGRHYDGAPSNKVDMCEAQGANMTDQEIRDLELAVQQLDADLAAARAEIERMASIFDRDLAAARAEIERLTFEVAQWKKNTALQEDRADTAQADLAAARAENEALRENYDAIKRHNAILFGENGTLRVQVDAARKALERIGAMPPEKDTATHSYGIGAAFYKVRDIAREALAHIRSGGSPEAPPEIAGLVDAIISEADDQRAEFMAGGVEPRYHGATGGFLRRIAAALTAQASEIARLREALALIKSGGSICTAENIADAALSPARQEEE